MARKATPTKTCTKSGKTYPATPEFFYRDKSQKDGLSPWSKEAERAYNKAYYAGLKKAKAPKVAAITTPAAKKAFEATMRTERVARGNKATTTTRRASRTKAKA